MNSPHRDYKVDIFSQFFSPPPEVTSFKSSSQQGYHAFKFLSTSAVAALAAAVPATQFGNLPGLIGVPKSSVQGVEVELTAQPTESFRTTFQIAGYAPLDLRAG